MTDPGVTSDVAGASEAERILLGAALEFYGAAEAVIDYAGPDRPRLRYDLDGLQQVRDAMAELEVHIRQAHDDGVAPADIARITRLDSEIVELILERHGAKPPNPVEG